MADDISVLLIDDEVTLRTMVRHRLEKRDGYTVHLAKNGAKGLKLARKKAPTIILLDWMMPGMSGIEVLQNLRKTPKTASIPVYMLTAKGKMGDAEKAFAAGADGYFTKPIDLKELSESLRRRLDELGQ